MIGISDDGIFKRTTFRCPVIETTVRLLFPSKWETVLDYCPSTSTDMTKVYIEPCYISFSINPNKLISSPKFDIILGMISMVRSVYFFILKWGEGEINVQRRKKNFLIKILLKQRTLSHATHTQTHNAHVHEFKIVFWFCCLAA